MFVPDLTAKNFVVYEDGVPQTIHDVKVTQTPITAVLLLEFAANNWVFIIDMRTFRPTSSSGSCGRTTISPC